jgi:hypothetical protein
MKRIFVRINMHFLILSLIIFILACFCFSGCKKDNVTDSNVLGGNYTIYTAGFLFNNGNFPCYWKGTSRTDLPGGIGAFTSSIFVSNGIVYTAGYYLNSKALQAPCYWMGTTRIDLPYDSTQEGYTTSIFVSNGNVYIAGHYTTWNKGLPCYWVNSIRNALVDSANWAFISSIYVVDTTIYLAGWHSFDKLSSNVVPCYWVGKTRTDLSIGNSSNGQANSLFVSGGIVYTCGYYGDMGNRIPCYWTGPVKTDLETGSSGTAVSICVDGGNIYTAGSLTQGGPCYWKGTSRTDLNGSDAVSICVKGGTVFTAGRYYKPNGPNDDFHVPCYWIDNNRVDLPVVNDHDHNSTTSIFVE